MVPHDPVWPRDAVHYTPTAWGRELWGLRNVSMFEGQTLATCRCGAERGSREAVARTQQTSRDSNPFKSVRPFLPPRPGTKSKCLCGRSTRERRLELRRVARASATLATSPSRAVRASTTQARGRGGGYRGGLWEQGQTRATAPGHQPPRGEPSKARDVREGRSSPGKASKARVLPMPRCLVPSKKMAS